MRFQREALDETMANEMMPLFEKHWREIAHYQDIQLKPDWEHYYRCQVGEILRLYTARDDGDCLVGYCVFFVRRNPHYQDSIQAAQDILFLDPKMRGSLNGFRFIKWCDDELRKEGVQAVYHHVKSAHDFGPALKRMGYELVDYIYAKRLDTKEGE